jgi:translation initiation factor 1 (eIF-1/SUI1)
MYNPFDDDITNNNSFLSNAIELSQKKIGSKNITIISGYCSDNNDELKNELKKLKKSLGCNGNIKDNNINLQGEHCNSIYLYLKNLGFNNIKIKG